MHVGAPVTYLITTVRIHDPTGRHTGTALIMKPEAGMAVLATIAVGVDLRHFERMQHVAKAARRPAAILFADLEASSPLARRLPTASYFALGRGRMEIFHVAGGTVSVRLTDDADGCVIADAALLRVVSR